MATRLAEMSAHAETVAAMTTVAEAAIQAEAVAEINAPVEATLEIIDYAAVLEQEAAISGGNRRADGARG